MNPTISAPDREAAWQRMVQADPREALKLRMQFDQGVRERVKTIDAAYDYAIERLANVNDEQSYQRVRWGFLSMIEPLGVDIADKVPASYPGPEGVRSLIMSAMDAKDQIAALQRGDRLTWDIEDDEIDNERLTRESEDRIQDRAARRALTRRGQDIASGDRRRGQDMTDRRERERPRRGAGGRVPTATNPKTGEKMEYRGGQWVKAR